MNMTNNESEAVFNAFDNFQNNPTVNLLEFVSPMIVTAWAKTDDKSDFTFTIFNSDDDNELNIDEFSIIVKCFTNGFRRWAYLTPLNDDQLLPLAKMLFEKIDTD